MINSMDAYDTFSSDYDRFVNWAGRLDLELPWLESQIQTASTARPARVLDAACGTGMHAIALAQRGYQAAGTDLSAGMVARARENARAAGVDVPFVAAGFGSLAGAFRQADAGQSLPPFDALLCLGNSLPHLLDLTSITAALHDFAACLRPGGLLVLQNRNFDAVLRQKERWMEPQSHREGEREWLFMRFYDFAPDGLINFNIVTLKRSGVDTWQQSVVSTPLYPLRQAELVDCLAKAGFGQLTSYGNMTGSSFEPETSGNLVITARVE